MVREIDFTQVRTLGDWLDWLTPSRQVALLEMWPDVSWDFAFTAREVFDCIMTYYGGATGNQVMAILADVFGWT